MPIKGENGGYKYKAFINGEWHDLTLSDSPSELTEWLQSNEEWTRVKHGHWILSEDRYFKTCSECGAEVDVSMGLGIFVDDIRVDEMNYCPNCGAKMDEVEE